MRVVYYAIARSELEVVALRIEVCRRQLSLHSLSDLGLLQPSHLRSWVWISGFLVVFTKHNRSSKVGKVPPLAFLPQQSLVGASRTVRQKRL